MTEPEPLGKFGQAVVTAVMVGGFCWLCKAAWQSDSLAFKIVMGLFVGYFVLAGLFIAMMMTAKWWQDRRGARGDR